MYSQKTGQGPVECSLGVLAAPLARYPNTEQTSNSDVEALFNPEAFLAALKALRHPRADMLKELDQLRPSSIRLLSCAECDRVVELCGEATG